MGGLAAAARLRVKGHDVLVLEQGPRAGGKLDRFERDGFVFDSGPSLLTLPAVYRDLFLKTGAPFEDVVDLQPLDTAFGYRFSDGSTLDLPGVDPGRIAAAMGHQLGGRAQQDWNDLMVRAGEVWRITRGPFITSPLAGASTLIKLATDPREVRAVAPLTTLRKLGRRHLADPRQVTILDRYATYQGSDPRRAPAALMTIPYVEQAFGAWHLGGGIATLADALTTRCLERGVEIRTGADVARVVTTSTGVTGVRLSDGEHIDADVVVANVDATTLYADLIDDPRARKPLRTVRRATPSLSGFVIMVGVRGRTAGTTTCGSPRTTTRSSMRSSVADLLPTPPSMPVCRTTPACALTRIPSRGSSSSTLLEMARSTGAGSANTMPTTCLTSSPVAVSTFGRGCSGGRSAPRPTSRRATGPLVGRSMARAATVCVRRSCDRPIFRQSRGYTSSVGHRIRAAAYRWSGSAPTSSPRRSVAHRTVDEVSALRADDVTMRGELSGCSCTG